MKNNETITARLVGLTSFVHQNFRIEYEGKEYVCKLDEPSNFYKLRDYVINPITLKILDSSSNPMIVKLC